MRRQRIYHQSVVPFIHDFFFHNGFEVAKIKHHSVLFVVNIIYRFSLYRYKKFVGMPVYILAFSIISVEDMSRLKSKNFSYPNHRAKIVIMI